MNQASEPLLASWSVISFPAMPVWPETYISVILHLVVSFFRTSRYLTISLEFKAFTLTALSAAWLPDMMNMCLLSLYPYWKMVSVEPRASECSIINNCFLQETLSLSSRPGITASKETTKIYLSGMQS
jgi:hypothetical protein